MCFTERIFYQCAHRSLAVLRLCPMTTAGHNFPVCELAPLKPFYAETMCAACERELHSRWVLIREWEHRWLHERGACSCDVTFPGILTTPRVIGETSSTVDASESSMATGNAHSASTEENKECSAPMAVTTAESSKNGQPKAGAQHAINQTATTTVAGNGRIPAIYSEKVTASGERHVAVRVPSLYAPEWREDHRALHESGKCRCPTTFTPFAPQIGDDELTPADTENLRHWRELETRRAQEKHGGRSHDEETARHIAEIEKVFGKFTAIGGPPRVPPLPHYFTAAYPAYTSPATYTNTIPEGAYRWETPRGASEADMLARERGLGPYRRGGFIYPDTNQPVPAPAPRPQSRGPTGPVPVPVRHRLPAPSQVQAQSQEAKTSDNNNNKGNAKATLPPEDIPICGLPIGAGPEGENQMPSWEGCALRNPRTIDAVTASAKKEDEAETQAAAGAQAEVEAEKCEEDKKGDDQGHDEGDDQIEQGEQDKGNGDDNEESSPRPLPQRRHSAST
ncbi:6e4b775e-de8e-4842-a52b-83f2a43e7a40 [Thermothielavioides terrestris]|uniref:6e4b775e-de8e-4842-a52b-83f2a43e7a40 n=1 Tax=Thermothielavioides terrestris TaxID=2587410 RepID=A0A3S4AIU8_9PEZI|nr:6e4b775e-de8e-4842-a52b-83f2a43e7a40 [Thermothielavioides terrestris]